MKLRIMKTSVNVRNLFETTGCKVSCHMPMFQAAIIENFRVYSGPPEDQVIQKTKIYIINYLRTSYSQMILYFLYTSQEYAILEQYYVYDMGSFIADIGGYLV